MFLVSIIRVLSLSTLLMESIIFKTSQVESPRETPSFEVLAIISSLEIECKKNLECALIPGKEPMLRLDA
jgi:hypothetical protein